MLPLDLATASRGDHPIITLYLRYTIDPNRLSDFAAYAAAEQIPIRESGGSILGYFAPTDFAGPTSEGFGLIDFPSLAEYEVYRAKLATHPRAPALCRADDAARQVATAVEFIAGSHAIEHVHIIAHSWGTMATGLFATREPGLVNRLVFFAPIAQRHGRGPPPSLPAWRLISEQEQWDRFVEDVPAGAAPVLSSIHFNDWSERYLATDAQSGTREPHSVKVPSGPLADIMAAWHGRLAYDPREVQAPVEIIRGEWDNLVTDRDARWLFDAFSRSPIRRDIKIGRATHLMHLEVNRHALHRESITFLRGDH